MQYNMPWVYELESAIKNYHINSSNSYADILTAMKTAINALEGDSLTMSNIAQQLLFAIGAGDNQSLLDHLELALLSNSSAEDFQSFFAQKLSAINDVKIFYYHSRCSSYKF
jgi:replication-associated recombination protein RarA